MIRYAFEVRRYWKVIVYYDMDYGFFSHVYNDLRGIGVADTDIKGIYDNMRLGNGMAFTCSSGHTSIVGFNRHADKYELVNSIVHEAEHVKQAMLKAYDVEDIGEPPAYTVGYIVMMMLKGISSLLC